MYLKIICSVNITHWLCVDHSQNLHGGSKELPENVVCFICKQIVFDLFMRSVIILNGVVHEYIVLSSYMLSCKDVIIPYREITCHSGRFIGI